MGKTKKSSLIKNAKKKNAQGSKKASRSVEELLEQAGSCLDEFDLEKAYQHVKIALDIEPKHCEALEMMASIQMEMGNEESSRAVYQKLVEIQPNEGFSKYMCLGQLASGKDSLEFYKKGIEIMLVEYNNNNNGDKPQSSAQNEEGEEEQGVSKLNISTAHCSIAELYLTDLCMETDAEIACKSYLDKSLEYDPTNAEALQLLASYWLSKENLDEARNAIVQSVDSWMPVYLEANEAGPLVDAAQAIALSYDSRINTSRILTEVKEYEKSIVVLEQLVEEDDEIVVVWYMLGWVSYCMGELNHSNAKYYLKRAQEISGKIKYEQRFLDDELKAHIVELLEKLTDVPTDDEAEEDEEASKENMKSVEDEGEDDEEDDSEYDTQSEDENENEEDTVMMDKNNNMNVVGNNSKLSKGASVKKSSSKNNGVGEEGMDLN